MVHPTCLTLLDGCLILSIKISDFSYNPFPEKKLAFDLKILIGATQYPCRRSSNHFLIATLGYTRNSTHLPNILTSTVLSSIIYSASTLLLAGISHASPTIPVKRHDIGTANFIFDDTHCEAEQADRDLVIAELEVASSMGAAAAGVKLDAENMWSK